MKRITFFALRGIFVVLCCVGIDRLFAQTQEMTLFDASNAPLDALQTQDAALEKTEDGIRVTFGTEDPWPGVRLSGDWNLAERPNVILSLVNRSETDVRVQCRFDCKKSVGEKGTYTASTVIPAHSEQNWAIPLAGSLNEEVRKKLFAMRGKPSGITTDLFSADNANKVRFDRSELTDLRIFQAQNGLGESIVIRSIDAPDEAVETYLDWPPEKFFPMIDRFGQFLHRDWPGKIHTLDELRANIAVEEADLTAHQSEDRTEFGGMASGPKQEATGHFYTKKIDSRWWLIDPTGALFWSHGVNCVGSGNGVTPTTGREFYFASLPADDSPEGAFYATGSNAIRSFNFTAQNAFLKYGDDWKKIYADRAHRRLKSWGMNTIGNWSDESIIALRRTPYTVTVGINSPRIEGSKGYWGKFVDPFHPEFEKAIRRALESKKEATANDPYCIGYFVDNELSWGAGGSLARAAVQSPKEQPVKGAMIAFLSEKYGGIEAMNAAWETEYASWDALAEQTSDVPKNETVNADCEAFYTVIAEKYFSSIAALIHEIAPDKLYLGCRFAWMNDLAQYAAAKYCDVISYNFYRPDNAQFYPAEGIDKPCMVGEFHFGALDRGMFHTGLVAVENQAARGRAYTEYVRSSLENPYLVGTHWFQFGDQATTGRYDGENFQVGLLDVCDTPYPETISAVRDVGANMYEWRANGPTIEEFAPQRE